MAFGVGVGVGGGGSAVTRANPVTLMNPVLPIRVPAPLAWLMRLDPLTYGLAALRACLDPAAMGLPPFVFSLGVALAFGAFTCAAAVATARRSVAA